MGFLKIGETDRDGRQKRIEHTGEYLRASRTGGISLRAHTRAAGVNVTGNTRHGLRLSTRLAKNTQVAFQNGRFILRGRYGSDAAKVNLSKSGVSVSTKTPVGTFNWFHPGRSSVKIAGVQLRGHKAAYLQAVYLVLALAVAAAGVLWQLAALAIHLPARAVQRVVARREQARQARERLNLSASEVVSAGRRILEAHGVCLDREPRRDLFAALVFTSVCLGRGQDRFEPVAAGMAAPESAGEHALLDDMRVAGAQVRGWLASAPERAAPAAVLGLMQQLAAAFGSRADVAARAEALLCLDDACLAAGPRTVLQEAMIDLLAETWDVDLLLDSEA